MTGEAGSSTSTTLEMALKSVQFICDQRTSNVTKANNWASENFDSEATLLDVQMAAAKIVNLAPANFLLTHERCGEQVDNDLPLSYFWEDDVKFKVNLVCMDCRTTNLEPDLKVVQKLTGRLEILCGLCHEVDELCDEVKKKPILDENHLQLVKQAVRVARNALRIVQNKATVESDAE